MALRGISELAPVELSEMANSYYGTRFVMWLHLFRRLFNARCQFISRGFLSQRGQVGVPSQGQGFFKLLKKQ